MNKSYETVYILKPDLPDDASKKIQEKIVGALSRRGGKLLAQVDLGKKPLAYILAHQNRGHYIQLNYEGGGDTVDDVEKNLRLTEEVLRFLTVSVSKSVGGAQ
jgi:small subunit ribosomal protein S6